MMEATRPRLFVELCCGSAAVTLRLLGGLRCKPPIAYMGSKRGYAGAILAAMGLRSGQGAGEVWLADAGPWGRVWGALADYETGMAVAERIMGWKDEDPRALWDRLRAEGVPDGSDAAGWLAVSATSYMADATRGFKATAGGDWPDTPPDITATADAVLSATRALNERRVKASCADIRTIAPPADCTGVYMYMDPPYEGTTGYAATLPRADVLAVAQRWSDAGAVVCVSEAVPLDLPGWHHVEITSARVGQKRTFSKQVREWLTMNREPAHRPAVQDDLFAVRA